jgi:hypothetical protein
MTTKKDIPSWATKPQAENIVTGEEPPVRAGELLRTSPTGTYLEYGSEVSVHSDATPEFWRGHLKITIHQVKHNPPGSPFETLRLKGSIVCRDGKLFFVSGVQGKKVELLTPGREGADAERKGYENMCGQVPELPIIAVRGSDKVTTQKLVLQYSMGDNKKYVCSLEKTSNDIDTAIEGFLNPRERVIDANNAIRLGLLAILAAAGLAWCANSDNGEVEDVPADMDVVLDEASE